MTWRVDHTFVNTDQNVPIGAKSNCSDIFAILERESKGFVAAQSKYWSHAGYRTDH
jgi:hypothetical protein